MKVKQAKLAQALRGESSNIIEDKNYHLSFDKGMLTAKLRVNPKGIGPFIIFPANIAYIEYQEDGAEQQAAPAPSQEAPPAVVSQRGRPKKGE